MLERVLDNLCENARRAGATCILLRIEESEAEVALHVDDDGAGVAPGDVDRIFAPGWSARRGSGPGLHAVATTVAVHGGVVSCQPLTHGTRFTVRLPVRRA